MVDVRSAAGIQMVLLATTVAEPKPLTKCSLGMFHLERMCLVQEPRLYQACMLILKVVRVLGQADVMCNDSPFLEMRGRAIAMLSDLGLLALYV
eukprot:568165-Amphidinium_carterae.1